MRTLFNERCVRRKREAQDAQKEELHLGKKLLVTRRDDLDTSCQDMYLHANEASPTWRAVNNERMADGRIPFDVVCRCRPPSIDLLARKECDTSGGRMHRELRGRPGTGLYIKDWACCCAVTTVASSRPCDLVAWPVS